MKKTNLLASTALVSAALCMAAGGANAASLKLGGYAEFWVGYADNEEAAGVNNDLDVKQDMEVHFLAEEKLDNGITVGARIEMEAGAGNPQGSGPGSTTLDTEFDESFGWVKTSFGQVNLGNNDQATGYTGGVRTVGPVGIFKSDAGDWLPGSYALNNTDVDLGLGDSQNVTYFTPRVGGFQAIVSYAPDSSDTNQDEFDRQETMGLHNGISGAVRFNRKFGGVGVGLSGGYTTVENSDTGAGDPDLHGWTAAADIRFGPARFTAAYAREDLATRDDQHWGASVLFSLSKMDTVSLGYGWGERDGSGTASDRDSNWITAGWERKLGKGISWQASVFHADADTGSGTGENKGIGAVGGFELSF